MGKRLHSLYAFFSILLCLLRSFSVRQIPTQSPNEEGTLEMGSNPAKPKPACGYADLGTTTHTATLGKRTVP